MSKPTVILLEDDDAQKLVATTVLRNAGYRVIDGMSIGDQFPSGTVAVVVDWMMPLPMEDQRDVLLRKSRASGVPACITSSCADHLEGIAPDDVTLLPKDGVAGPVLDWLRRIAPARPSKKLSGVLASFLAAFSG